jgi:hypothetical protein
MKNILKILFQCWSNRLHRITEISTKIFSNLRRFDEIFQFFFLFLVFVVFVFRIEFHFRTSGELWYDMNISIWQKNIYCIYGIWNHSVGYFYEFFRQVHSYCHDFHISYRIYHLLTYYEFYMNISWNCSSSNIAFFDCTLSDFEVRDARTITHILFICRISFEVQAYILRSISLWNCNCNSKYPKL